MTTIMTIPHTLPTAFVQCGYYMKPVTPSKLGRLWQIQLHQLTAALGGLTLANGKGQVLALADDNSQALAAVIGH